MTRLSPKIHKFFKAYLPEKCSQQLKIPKAFNKYLNVVVPFKAKLTCPSKRSWHVNVKEVEGRIVFDKGWSMFVEDNSLHMKDFLVFSYDGNTEFHVNVYGENHCEKDATITVESDIPLACNSSETMSQDDMEDSSKFVSKYPFFRTVLTPSYVHKRYMHISSKFSRVNMDTTCGTATLEYANKFWPVVIFIGHGRMLNFSGGWSKFVEDNNLQVGNVCLFELINKKNNDYNFKVSICRR